MTNFIGKFNVVPSLPENMEPLRSIAYNIYWSWNHDAVELFRRLDREIWEETNHNPVQLLGKVSQERLIEVSTDDGFISHMNRVFLQLSVYLEEVTWYQKKVKADDKPFVAYFSAEFGLTECLQIYSGGLGVLAGDHLKSASDMGIPLIGIGLCYKEGYFQQYLTSDGWQQERYNLTDFYNQPMEIVKDDDGNAIKLSLKFPGRDLYYQIWKIQVGRVPLYLLDTNVDENSVNDKTITRALYGGGTDTRIEQEILLGIGGLRALHALGIYPKVCHMNEGHSAFLALERIRLLIEQGLSFQEAKDIGFYSNVFTTHTPVPAGIDVFPNDLMERYFGNYYRNELKISDKEFYSLGNIKKENSHNFNMAHLAMNMSGFVNGVSKLHSVVSKKMWAEGFEKIPFDEIPLDHITNGVHTRSHISNEMYELLFRYLGNRFIKNPSDPEIWKVIDEIPDEELWRTHERRRERLVAFTRGRLKKQIMEKGGSLSDLAWAKEVLDSTALTIGFARRFATYKRANLFLKDIERLASILCNTEFPVQIIIAGKAHPRDDAGKQIIQEIVNISKHEALRKKIVFIENYDMNVARYMVEGCDVWLNNPRRPLEASGTSGMKIIGNGGLNFSVLDGWWDEGFNQNVGWAIGSGEEYEDHDYQDEIESRLIYDTLEKEIARVFYERGEDKLPRNWIKMMKNSFKELTPEFNTHRMVGEYFDKFYKKAYDKRQILMENDWKKAKDFTIWKTNVINNWDKVRFIKIDQLESSNEIKVGQEYTIKAEIFLGKILPEDVVVEIYFGSIDDQLKEGANQTSKMNYIKAKSKSGNHTYEGQIVCNTSGNFGFTLRILPDHPILINPFELGLIKWA